ncbi:MaoC family dehydratase [Actinomadura barringtoniae]|uniref:MaoC family dehydratase n=1 Tax=Actinomadura barringtoniae TaxID=1427535 RepID=A0A939PD13_9ACTN|nr:MaoC family dehydratase [Actinomadura barringtoniae]MBO2447813.1 MaoC family dehydratase [Actinomadura barringtoniae]
MRTPQRTALNGPYELLDLVGSELGASQTRVVTQDEIDRFADVTGDHQWIHVDVERAVAGPFGGTIAHGFLTLALVPRLLADILTIENVSMGVNYGLDRVRFVRPLPPGTEIQGVATLVSAERVPARGGGQEGVQAKASVVVEFANDASTCCVAEILFRYHP